MARKLVVEIIGDASSLERAFDRSAKSARKFNGDMDRATRGAVAGTGAFSKFGRSVAFSSSSFLGGLGLTAAIKNAVDASSDLNEQMGKTDVVFGQSAEQVKDWAKTTTDAFAISQRQALATASSFGALLTPLGIVGQQAAQQAEKLTELGADLASFYNTSVQDALDAIQSGLVGEQEPLRRYGVLLSETRVQQQALTDTGKKHAAQLTNQEKALARIKIILQDTVPAQGDSQRSMGRLAEQTKKAQANFDDLQTEIGTGLIPMLTAAARAANQLAAALKGAGDANKGLKGHLGRFGFLSDVLGAFKVPGMAPLIAAQKAVEAIADAVKKAKAAAAAPGLRGAVGSGVPGVVGPLQGLLPAVTTADVAKAKRSAEQLNRWFDAMIGRKTFRAGLLPLRQQLAVLDQVSKLLTARIKITKDITRKLNLEDQLLQVNADRAGIRAELRQQMLDQAAQRKELATQAAQAARDEARAWADFAIERAAATKTLKDDLKAAQAKLKLLEQQAGAGKKTAEQAREIWEAQQEVIRIRKEMARNEGRDRTLFTHLSPGAALARLGLTGLSPAQMRRAEVALAQMGPGLAVPARRSAAFAGIVVNGDVNVHGVQDTKGIEREIHRRSKARANTRRGAQ